MRYFLILLILISKSVVSANFEHDLADSALERTNFNIRYDGSYFSMAYPNGDVPENVGVCTDVIIRAYRKIGADLQQLVHEDMANNFSDYPSKRIWGLKRTDKNIDHRRVPNLQAFFRRNGEELPLTLQAKDYQAGHLVTWMLPGNLPHIGIVTQLVSEKTGYPLIVHNIGSGPQLEDMLFRYKITGHYKYRPESYP